MSPPRILIVEDQWITAADIQENLLQMGYEVSAVVATGPHAIEAARERPPDLVLMDIGLKGPMDGIEAARELIRLRVGVVFLTAHNDDETFTRAQSAKPLGYLVKPFGESDLQNSIRIALCRHQSRCQAGRYGGAFVWSRQRLIPDSPGTQVPVISMGASEAAPSDSTQAVTLCPMRNQCARFAAAG